MKKYFREKGVLLRVKRKSSFTTKETKQIRMRIFTWNKVSTTEEKIKQEFIDSNENSLL